MKKVYALVFLMIVLATTVMATTGTVQTLGTFKENTDVVLYQMCDNCTYVNISYVSYPNLTIALSNVAMAKNGVQYSYTFYAPNTTDYGRYLVCGSGNNNGQVATWCYDFFINGTGRAEPSGAVLTFFIIAFILIVGFLIYMFIYSFGHALKKDFDIIDLAFDWGIYFALIAFYILQNQYLGSPAMYGILDILVIVGAFTHIMGSSIFFVMTLIYSSLQKSKQQMGIKTT